MDLIAKVYDDLKDGDEDGQQDANDLSNKHFLDIVDAFEMPAWRWQEEAKVFERSADPSRLPKRLGADKTLLQSSEGVACTGTDWQGAIPAGPVQRHQADHPPQRALQSAHHHRPRA